MAFVAVLVAALLIAGAARVLSDQANDYFALSPGTAPVVSADPACRALNNGTYALPGRIPCVKLVLPADKIQDVDGSVRMVDVLEGPATIPQYVLDKLNLLHTFDKGVSLLPASAVLGSTPASQLTCQNNEDMTDATSAAAVVALRRLGYTVQQNDLGALVYVVVPGTAAAKAGVQCNDLITSVDGTPVHTDVDLTADIHAQKPGDTIHLTVLRVGEGGKQLPVQLSAQLTGTPAGPGQAAQPDKPFLGVSTSTDTTFTFPFEVTIEVGDIGGPSAGLALTLGLLDALSNGHLTGGHRIAATGTIDLDGNVGAIGDAAQKAIAVRRAGAQIFFVPTGQNYKDALTEAGSMKVYAVSTLQQALDDLESLGGQVPPPVPAASQTSSG